MKIIKECQIAGQEYHISDLMVVLELNNTGRGYVVIAADEGDFVGKPVTIKVGTYDYFYQYLQGFVEQEQDEQPGYKKLLIKEVRTVFKLFHSPRHIKRRLRFCYTANRYSS